MATISIANVAGDALQLGDFAAKSGHETKGIQISIVSVEDDDNSSDGKHSSDSVDTERSRQNTEERIARLQEDINTLKQDLERCIQQAVAASRTSSAPEKKRLQGKTNAAYKAWAARELVLNDLLVSSISCDGGNHLLTLCRARSRPQITAPPGALPQRAQEL
jgi:hypothetical protein